MSLVRFDPCLVAVKQLFIVSQINIAGVQPGQVLPYITYIRVCAAQRDFEAPDLERGIHF